MKDFVKITKNNKVNKIVLTKSSSKELIELVKNCEYVERKKLIYEIQETHLIRIIWIIFI